MHVYQPSSISSLCVCLADWPHAMGPGLVVRQATCLCSEFPGLRIFTSLPQLIEVISAVPPGLSADANVPASILTPLV